MKKFFMTLAVVMIAVCANAQVYLGGNVGIASVDYGGDDDETIYSLLPEIGYKFNDNWLPVLCSDGLRLDSRLTMASLLHQSALLLTHLKSALCTLYIPAQQTYQRICEGGFGYKHYNGADDVLSIGLNRA